MQMMIDIDQLNTEALAAPANRPVIGITGNFNEGQLKLLPGYFRSIEAAGGTPVVIPPRRKPDASLISLIDRIDGLLLSGGADINPILMGEDPVPALHGINNERDAFELALTRLAYNRQVPMLGICRGIQVLAAALGGTVMQDIATTMPHSTLSSTHKTLTAGWPHTLSRLRPTLLSDGCWAHALPSTPSTTKPWANLAPTLG